jgi:WD40 repeat protein
MQDLLKEINHQNILPNLNVGSFASLNENSNSSFASLNNNNNNLFYSSSESLNNNNNNNNKSKPMKDLASKVQPNGWFQKMNVSHQRLADSCSILLYFNVGNTFICTTIDRNCDDFLFSLQFKSTITCHNVFDKNIIIGFQNGELLYINGDKFFYKRFNKESNQLMSQKPITCVKWISNTVFYAGFPNGLFLSFNITKTSTIPINLMEINNEINSSPDKKLDSMLKLSIIATKHNPICLGIVKYPLTFLCFSANKLCVCTSKGYAVVTTLDQENSFKIFRIKQGGVICADFSPDEKYIAIGGQDDLIYVFEIETGSCVKCVGHKSWINCIVFDIYCRNSIRLYSVGEDRNLCCWEIVDFNSDNYEPLFVQKVHDFPTTSVVCTSTYIITASREGSIKIWSKQVEQTEQVETNK